MVKVYYDQDITTDELRGKTIAVVGYGIQGRAQALNLRDSGYNVILGLRLEGPSREQAERDGFAVFSVPEASERADLIILLTPDMPMPDVYRNEVAPHLREGKALGFSHGFNIHFRQIVPPPHVDVIMVAPKAPGKRLRELYLQGFGTPALVAIHQNYTGKAEQLALEWARGLGCGRAGVLSTTFKDETESDLIGEQVVLVGGVMELLKKSFEVLVEEGYPPELAYFEACNELKLIVDLIYEKGVIGMLHGVSVTARFGGLTVGPRIIDEHVKENMRRAAADVKSGKFAREWVEEYRRGCPTFNELLKAVEEHPIEKVGSFIRKMSGIEK